MINEVKRKLSMLDDKSTTQGMQYKWVVGADDDNDDDDSYGDCDGTCCCDDDSCDDSGDGGDCTDQGPGQLCYSITQALTKTFI